VLRSRRWPTDPRFAGNAQRTAHRETLRGLIIVDAFRRPDGRAGDVQRLEQAQIANAELRDMAGLWRHPQLAARGALAHGGHARRPGAGAAAAGAAGADARPAHGCRARARPAHRRDPGRAGPGRRSDRRLRSACAV
jgi:crotonobetainyl-CoA:carnitine CoA-transferase CaiB-like acyl-CoA transferase